MGVGGGREDDIFYVLRLQNVCNGCQRLLFVVRPVVKR